MNTRGPIDLRGRVTKINQKPIRKPGLGQQLSSDKKAAGLGPLAGLLGLGGLAYAAHKALSAGKEVLGENKTFILNESARIEIANEVRRRINDN